jgi:hypothetical protein
MGTWCLETGKSKHPVPALSHPVSRYLNLLAPLHENNHRALQDKDGGAVALYDA